MSSNIIFSFDAEAVGAIAAVEGMASSLQSLISVAEGVVSSFANIANSSATMMSAWGALMNNIGSLTGGLQDSSAAMGGAGRSASDLAYQLQRLGEEAAKAATRHQEAVQQIQEQEADLTAKTQTEIARREASYNESLAKAVQNHQDALTQIQEQENSLNENYADQMDATLRRLNNPVALAHQQTLTALETQLAALLSSGQAGSAAVAQLEQQITAENSKYQAFLNTTITPYYQFLDKKNYDHHQTALEQLQDRLTKENRDYAQHTADLQTQLDQQLSDINTNYAKQERNLEEHLARENESYAEQMQSIAEQRQHLFSKGGGAGGAIGGIGALPPIAKSLWLYDMLGIDPHSDPVAAENALMTWITGGSFNYKGKTTDFGMGQDTESQMTLPQIFTIVSQAINYGQDPTRKTHGNENYVNLFSDLLALSSVGKPGLDENTRFNSLTNILEKAMTGQTYGMNRQLMNVGIDPELLGKYGVKFGGTKGETIENPEALFGALMNYAYERAPGLGEYQAHHTPMGLVNLIKDWWSGIVFGVTGNINDPGSLIAKFTDQFNRFVGFLYDHRPEIEQFGRTVATWLVDKFKAFNDWLGSADAKKKLDEIGKALHDIGDALHWMSQHKDIVLAVMGLLGAQVGSKILGGLGGGLVTGVMKGGLFGATGQGVSGIAGLAGGPLINLLGGLLTGGNKPLGMLTKDDPSLLSALARSAMIFDAIPNTVNKPGSLVSDADKAFFDLFKGRAPRDATPLNQDAIYPFSGPGLENYFKHGALQGLDPFAAANTGGKGKLSDIEQMALRAPKGTANAGGLLEGALASEAPQAGGLLSKLPMLAGLGPMLTGLGPALGGIAAAAGPIALVAAAIGGLIFLLVANKDKIKPFIDMLAHFFGDQLKQASKAIQDFVKQVEDRLGPAFGPGSFVYNALQFFSQFWAGAWGGIKLAFSGVWDVISGIIKIAWSIISNIILIGLDLLSGKWGNVWKDIQHLLGGVWDGIKQVIGGALKIVGGLLLGFFGGIWNLIKTPLMALGGFIFGVVKGLWHYFIEPLLFIVGLILGLFWMLGSWILAPFIALGKAIFNWFQGIWKNYIQPPLMLAIGLIIAQFENLWNNVVTPLLKFGKSVLDFFGGIWKNYIQKPLSDLWTSISNWFSGIPAAIGGWLSGLGDAISKAFKALGNFTHTIFAWIIDNSGPLKGPLQGMAHDLHVPGYAAGGRYAGGQVATVGERGQELFFSGYQGLFVSNAQIRSAMNEAGSSGTQGGYGRGIYIANLNLPGVRNATDFYRELNAISGRYAEYGNRAGLPS